MADISAVKRMDTSKIYYASQKEVQAAMDRAARTKANKAEFQKKVSNPMRGLSKGGYIFDPGMQRFASMKVAMYDNYRFNMRNLWKFMLSSVIPIILLTKYLNHEHDRNEKAFRSGSIPYAERLWKY